MTSPFVLWLAGVLGWSEPGLVIVLLTVLGFLVLFFVIRILVIDLPYWLADKRNQAAAGPVRIAIGVLLVLAVVVSVFINFIITVLAILAILGFLGQARDWLKG